MRLRRVARGTAEVGLLVIELLLILVKDTDGILSVWNTNLG